MMHFRRLLVAAMLTTVTAMCGATTACAEEIWTTTETGASCFSVVGEGGETTVYQGWYQNPSDGSWYYFKDGVLQSGWIIDDGSFYYLDPSDGKMAADQMVGNFYVGPDGAALHDTTAPDGTKLDYNGSRISKAGTVEELNEKTYTYRELLRKNPNLIAEFSDRSSGSGHQIMRETERGFTWITYATMKLYEPTSDGRKGTMIYEGDGAFRSDALIERKQADGSISYINPGSLVSDDRQQWTAGYIRIDPAGFISYASDEG